MSTLFTAMFQANPMLASAPPASTLEPQPAISGKWLFASLVSFFALAAEYRPAAAADFGGNCCADLEERIADLEATTARKGNRKVSLTLSGQVSQALLAWDDGDESDAYVVTNSNSGNRIRLDGLAKISNELSAGYYIELGVNLGSSGGVDQLDDESGSGPNLRQSLWYLRSKSLGSFTMGLASPATDGIIGFNMGGTSIAGDSDTGAFGTGLFTRDSSRSGSTDLNSLSSGNTISLRWRRFVEQLDTNRGSIIRYDTPVFMGLTASAAWGEDDFWDVAVRFAKKTDHFRFAMGAGFYKQTDEDEDTFGWPRGGDREPDSGNTIVREWKGSASILHEHTGLFLTGAYVHREFDGSDLGVVTFACFTSADAAAIRAAGVECGNRPDFDYYYLQAGIKRRFNSLGYTSIFGEYARSEDAVTGLNVSVRSAVGGDLDYVTSSTMDIWGAGIVQHISQAEMDVFVSYRHFEAEVEGLESSGQRIKAPIDDADVILTGSRIRF
ncbi:MAG: porin [Hyphomicrobium sp.]